MSLNGPANSRELSAILALDIHAPGVAGKFLRAPIRQRHMMAAYLAPFIQSDPIVLGDADTHAFRIRDLSPSRGLLETAYGVLPAGFVGAVQKAGGEVAEFDFYRRLFGILSDQPCSQGARVIRQLASVSEHTLTALALLPPEIQITPVLATLTNDDAVHQLARLWALFDENGIATADARRGLRQAARTGSLDAFLQNWPLRLRFPVNPITDCERYTAVIDGFDLRRVALSYRNCARGLLPDLLDGANFLGEYRPLGGHPPVLLRLVRTDYGPTLEDINGYRNRPLTRALEREVHVFVNENDVAIGPVRRGKASRWEPLRRQMRGGGDWAFDF